MYVLTISFCGKNYHGWQFQTNAVTVQGILKKALCSIFKKEVPFPAGCSRTDAGVHALEFLATIPKLHDIPANSLKKGLNSLLPEDIRVLNIEERDGFRDGRELVFGKHYRYLVCNRETPSPFASKFSWHSPYKLDLPAMEEGIAHFRGTHDFTSFMASGSDVKTTERTILKAEIVKSGDYLFFDFLGEGFLKHQIRIMCGTLIGVGKFKMLPNAIPELIKAKNRELVPQTLPGKGLFLCKVFRTVKEFESYSFPQNFENMTW